MTKKETKLVHVQIPTELYTTVEKVVARKYYYSSISDFIRCALIHKVQQEDSEDKKLKK